MDACLDVTEENDWERKWEEAVYDPVCKSGGL